MIKAYIVTFLLLSSAQLITAQDEPTRSIAELNSLFQKASVDSQKVSLLLESAMVYIWKQGMEKNDFDSALFFASRAKAVSASLNDPEWRIRCLNVYAQLYREGNQIEKARLYIDSAIAIATQYNEKKGLARAYMELQNYFNIYAESEWKDKIKALEQAQRLYGETGDQLKRADLLKHLGDCYQVRKLDSMALKHLNEALVLYKSLQIETVQGVYDLIGYIYTNQRNFQLGLKYGLLAMQTAERLKTGERELSTIYNRVALTYYRLTQYREAEVYFNKAFSLALKVKDTLAARNISISVIDAYLRLGSQKELIGFLEKCRFINDMPAMRFRHLYLSNYVLAYMLTNDHKKAAPYLKELLPLVNDSSTVSQRVLLCRAAIPYYLAVGEYKEMYKYLPYHDSISRLHKIISSVADNNLWWYKADSALGNLSGAIAHYKAYKEASDSSLRYIASQQINQLIIQHETYKKDQELAIKESNILLLNRQVRQTKLVRNLSYGLAGLMLLVIGLLYSRYMIKQRSNRKLQQQQQEINDKNIVLQKVVNQKEKLLVEKEWLLKEVHHRVKNNMQLIMSLLNLQSNYIDNEKALSAIHESENRVHAMSLIHQRLYSTDNVASIDMSVYIRELVSHLSDSFNSGQLIHFDLMIDPIELDVSQAVPLGLILNEAVTNSIKYAFPRGNGVISVSFNSSSFDQCLLVISDNGIGMPADFKDKKPGSLGISLIEGLSEDLEGNCSIESNNGTTITISFARRAVIQPPEKGTETLITVN